MSLRPPNAANSEEEYLEVYNLDLPELSPSELEEQVLRAHRIAARDPQAFVWRGMTHISARQWADERVRMARKLLGTTARPADRRRRIGRAWVR